MRSIPHIIIYTKDCIQNFHIIITSDYNYKLKLVNETSSKIMSELVTVQPLHRESIEVLNMLKTMNIKPLYEMESVEVARASVSAELGGQVEYDGTRTEVIVPLSDVPGLIHTDNHVVLILWNHLIESDILLVSKIGNIQRHGFRSLNKE